MLIKQFPSVAVAKTKIYGRGTLNLPKNVLEVAGINPNDEVLLQAKEGEIRVRRIKRLEELMGALPATETVTVAFPYHFRGAFGDAFEFFEAVRRGLPFGEEWETGEFSGKVYLKPKGEDIRNTIHISYFELPNYPDGAITIDGGIKEFGGKEEQIKANKKKIEETLNQLGINPQPFGNNGYLIKIAPAFEVDEAATLSSILTFLVKCPKE